MFVATAKSSDSKTARPNPSSYSARTRGELHGRCYSGGNTRRVSLRSVKMQISFWANLEFSCSRSMRGSGGVVHHTSSNATYPYPHLPPSLPVVVSPPNENISTRSILIISFPSTGSRQEAYPPHRQATTWYRRCLP